MAVRDPRTTFGFFTEWPEAHVLYKRGIVRNKKAVGAAVDSACRKCTKLNFHCIWNLLHLKSIAQLKSVFDTSIHPRFGGKFRIVKILKEKQFGKLLLIKLIVSDWTNVGNENNNGNSDNWIQVRIWRFPLKNELPSLNSILIIGDCSAKLKSIHNEKQIHVQFEDIKIVKNLIEPSKQDGRSIEIDMIPSFIMDSDDSDYEKIDCNFGNNNNEMINLESFIKVEMMLNDINDDNDMLDLFDLSNDDIEMNGNVNEKEWQKWIEQMIAINKQFDISSQACLNDENEMLIKDKVNNIGQFNQFLEIMMNKLQRLHNRMDGMVQGLNMKMKREIGHNLILNGDEIIIPPSDDEDQECNNNDNNNNHNTNNYNNGNTSHINDNNNNYNTEMDEESMLLGMSMDQPQRMQANFDRNLNLCDAIDIVFRWIVWHFDTFSSLRKNFEKIDNIPNSSNMSHLGTFFVLLLQIFESNDFKGIDSQNGETELVKSYAALGDAILQHLLSKDDIVGMIMQKEYQLLPGTGQIILDAIKKLLFATKNESQNLIFKDNKREIFFREMLKRQYYNEFETYHMIETINNGSNNRKQIVKVNEENGITVMVNVLSKTLTITQRAQAVVNQELLNYQNYCNDRNLRNNPNQIFAKSYSKMICQLCYNVGNPLRVCLECIDSNIEDKSIKICAICHKRLEYSIQIWNFYHHLLQWKHWSHLFQGKESLAKEKAMMGLLAGIALKTLIYKAQTF